MQSRQTRPQPTKIRIDPKAQHIELSNSTNSENKISLNFQGETLELLPEKAFFWKSSSILGFSDVHLGKAESYQAAGVPMPSGSHFEDLSMISTLIERHQPKTVLILGDWIHQRSSWTQEIEGDFQRFFKAHEKQQWILILGNHERGSIEYLQKLPINIVIEELEIGPLLFTHGHHSERAKFSIQGHIHPTVRLREGSTSVRLPAFILKKNTLILPAFGSQTGGHDLHLHSKDRVFPTTGTSIFELNRSASRI
jgi:hypothetical protein